MLKRVYYYGTLVDSLIGQCSQHVADVEVKTSQEKSLDWRNQECEYTHTLLIVMNIVRT